MKKIALIVVVCTSIFFSCKKEDKTTEPEQPATLTTPKCTTCPYCSIDTTVIDTLPHMVATIDDTIHFVATELHDTIIEGGLLLIYRFKAKNTFITGSPEIELVRSNGLVNIPYQFDIKDTASNIYMTYKVNNITYHSKKGLIFDKKWVIKQKPPTYYQYFSNYDAYFCFNTDTIAGVSHKIKLGSVKVKHL